MWPNHARHDLRSICETLHINLQHHAALSDARACGLLLDRAIQQSGLSVADWLARNATERPTSKASPRRHRYSERIEAVGACDGPLAGHVLVCTGDFDIGERALVDLAASLGCDVKERFTKKTTILVSGRRDPQQFDGKPKSRKLLDAEAAQNAGRHLRILTEQEFLGMVASLKVKQPA